MLTKYQKLTDEIVHKVYSIESEFTLQKKGSAADYILKDSRCLEVKVDASAERYGNIFVEYANQSEDKVYDSGITLSARRNYTVLYILPFRETIQLYEIPAMELLKLAETYGIHTKTRPRKNGNRENFYGLGYKLKLEYIKPYFIGVEPIWGNY